MSKPPERIQTRAKNATQHPGNAIPKRKRRTKAEMIRDQEREQLEKDAAEKLKRGRLQSLASLEGKIAKEDAQAHTGFPGLQKKEGLRPAEGSAKGGRRVNKSDTGKQRIDNKPAEVMLVEESSQDSDEQEDYAGKRADDQDIFMPDDGNNDDADDEGSLGTAELEEAPKKRKKVQKTKVRDAIKVYQQSASGDEASK